MEGGAPSGSTRRAREPVPSPSVADDTAGLLLRDVQDLVGAAAAERRITWTSAATILRAVERETLPPEDRVVARDQDRDLEIAWQHWKWQREADFARLGYDGFVEDLRGRRAP